MSGCSFDQAAAPDRLRQAADAVAAAAGIAAETYPTRKALRLPLGVHRWTGRRGQLVLPDGQTIDLDAGTAVIADALQLLDDLPRNPLSQLPAPATPIRPAPASRPPRDGLEGTRFSIARYNQGTDLVALLESYGGRVVHRSRSGGAVLACPCGRHAHGDATPSLEVKPATSSRYGRFVAHGYAPGCLFFTERGQVIDAFGVFCRLEQLTPAEAVRRLARGSQTASHGAGRGGLTSSSCGAARTRCGRRPAMTAASLAHLRYDAHEPLPAFRERQRQAYQAGKSAWRDSQITAQALQLYEELVRFVGANRFAWVKEQTLAGELRRSASTIKRWMQQLVEANLIRRERRFGATSLTYITAYEPDADVDTPLEQAADAALPAAESSSGGAPGHACRRRARGALGRGARGERGGKQRRSETSRSFFWVHG